MGTVLARDSTSASAKAPSLHAAHSVLDVLGARQLLCWLGNTADTAGTTRACNQPVTVRKALVLCTTRACIQPVTMRKALVLCCWYRFCTAGFTRQDAPELIALVHRQAVGVAQQLRHLAEPKVEGKGRQHAQHNGARDAKPQRRLHMYFASAAGVQTPMVQGNAQHILQERLGSVQCSLRRAQDTVGQG